MAGQYEVDYNDSRLTAVKNEQATKEQEIKQRYDDLINNTDNYYNNLINNSKEWAEKQTNIQNEQTEQTIKEINQQQEQTQNDYMKEQKASYADYQKQSNAYGVQAEQIAASGLRNSGYTETSLVNMYTAYQNRVASARESLNKAVLNFQNSIAQAKLANNAKIAEIAESAIEQQLNLSLQNFQYKNTLIEAKETQIASNTDRYNNQYQQVLAQINQEIENRKWEAEQAAEQERWNKEYAMEKEKIALQRQELQKNMEYINAQIANLNAKTAAAKSSNSGTVSFTSSNNKNSYNSVLSMAKRQAQMPGLGKATARATIATAYQNGKITKDQANSLFSQLKL